MNSQLYTAASGLVVESRRLELIAGNLANASTGGFRAQRTFSSVYDGVGRGRGPFGAAANRAVALAGSYELRGPGPQRETAGPLDVVLEPDHLLVVQTAAGRRYTRSGALGLSPAGDLVDNAGHRLLGAGGTPIGGLGDQAALGPDGRLLERGEERGRLWVVRDPAQLLHHDADGLLTAEGRDAELETVVEPKLRPGWLEGSNTEALGELVALIEAQRAFESYQRLVSLTMNDVNRLIINEVAG